LPGGDPPMRRKHGMCPKAAGSQELTFDRRAFIQATAAVTGLTALGTTQTLAQGAAPRTAPGQPTFGMPGPFPGRVIEVRDPNSVQDGVPQLDAVRKMIARGITTLTGIREPVEAWRSMVTSDAGAGIKVH